MKTKKWIIVIILALLLGGGGAGAYLYYAAPRVQTTAPEVSVPTPEAKAKLVQWDDPAGFTFSYIDGMTINRHDEDKENYAHVEFTHPAHPGSLIVWAKDLPKGVTDTALWVKKDATLSAAVSIDTTLGQVAAQKLLVASPQKKQIVGAVADGLLFYVEATLTDEAYWQTAAETVVGSFAFVPLDGAAGQGSNAAPAASANTESYDEEEILE
jgi:hypothetical protein